MILLKFKYEKKDEKLFNDFKKTLLLTSMNINKINNILHRIKLRLRINENVI